MTDIIDIGTADQNNVRTEGGLDYGHIEVFDSKCQNLRFPF